MIESFHVGDVIYYNSVLGRITKRNYRNEYTIEFEKPIWPFHQQGGSKVWKMTEQQIREICTVLTVVGE